MPVGRQAAVQTQRAAGLQDQRVGGNRVRQQTRHRRSAANGVATELEIIASAVFGQLGGAEIAVQIDAALQRIAVVRRGRIERDTTGVDQTVDGAGCRRLDHDIAGAAGQTNRVAFDQTCGTDGQGVLRGQIDQ